LGIVGNWTELRPMQSPESQEVIELWNSRPTRIIINMK
jgi:hypothetical protein